MATRIKGICKGIKHISHLFAVKERDIEIGYPTDVKHVAHIGVDGSDGSAPSWMRDFKNGSDFSAAASAGSSMSLSREQTWSSQDFDQQSSIGRQPSTDIFHNFPPTNVPKVPKKERRKKVKSLSSSTSSPKKSSSSSKMSNSSSRSSLVSRKSNLKEENVNQLK